MSTNIPHLAFHDGSALRDSEDGAGRAEHKMQPWPASIPAARLTARTPSLPGAGGRSRPLQGTLTPAMESEER